MRQPASALQVWKPDLVLGFLCVCRHPNIIQLLGAHLQGDAYLVLEPMARTLSQALTDPQLSAELSWCQR